MLRIRLPLLCIGVLCLAGLAGSLYGQAPDGQTVPKSKNTVLTKESLLQLLAQAGYEAAAGSSKPMWSVFDPKTGKKLLITATKMQGSNLLGLKIYSYVPYPAGGVTAQKIQAVEYQLAPTCTLLKPKDGKGKFGVMVLHDSGESNPQELKRMIETVLAKADLAYQLLHGNGPGAGKLDPGPVPVTDLNLAGIWKGWENLPGFGELKFVLQANGQATMIDAHGGPYFGTWIKQDNQVTIYLPKIALYQGTINGTTITGQGKDSKGSWNFSVTKQTPLSAKKVKAK